MTQSQAAPVVIALIVLETVNTLVNILPARKQPTEAGRRKYLLRAGIVNLVIIAAFAVYLLLYRR